MITKWHSASSRTKFVQWHLVEPLICILGRLPTAALASPATILFGALTMKKSEKRRLRPPIISSPTDLHAKALAEDAEVKNIFYEARNRPPAPVVTAQSVRQGAALMVSFRKGSVAALMRRIERKELLTKHELVERLDGNRRWVTAALKSERLFSVQTPSGVDYFPSFYGDASTDLRALGKVAKALSGLPGQSKYHFFVNKSLSLGMSPLDALAKGRVREVLAVAAGFAIR